LTHAEPIGAIRIADGAMLEAMDRATMVICPWGAHAAAAAHATDLMHIVRIAGMRNKLFHLGLDKDGSPKHPHKPRKAIVFAHLLEQGARVGLHG
jgi:hypothetical protein